MFGAGWTEMIIIGVVALVVIGPKDLPIVMRKLGRVVATVRRMGTEFQREIAKTTGFDEISDLKRSLTEPLRQTSEDIKREFNKVTATGLVEPSGVIKPTDPKVESVYDQIVANSAMPEVPTTGPAAVASSMTAAPPVMKPLASSVVEPSPAPAEASVLPPAVEAAPVKPKRASRAKAVPVPGEASIKAERKPAAATKPATAKARAPRKPAPETVSVEAISTVAPAAANDVEGVKPTARPRAKKA